MHSNLGHGVLQMFLSTQINCKQSQAACANSKLEKKGKKISYLAGADRTFVVQTAEVEAAQQAAQSALMAEMDLVRRQKVALEEHSRRLELQVHQAVWATRCESTTKVPAMRLLKYYRTS